MLEVEGSVQDESLCVVRMATDRSAASLEKLLPHLVRVPERDLFSQSLRSQVGQAVPRKLHDDLEGREVVVKVDSLSHGRGDQNRVGAKAVLFKNVLVSDIIQTD